MSVQGGVEEMKSGRVVVTPEVESMSDIWFYQDGFIKNKVWSWSLLTLRRPPTWWQSFQTPLASSPYHFIAAAGPEHEPPSYGQHRAGSQGGSVDGEPAAHPDVDGPDERSHH